MAARKIPDWEKEKRADLRERYGGMMNLTQVQRELGALSPKTARAWLTGLTHSKVGKQKKWAIEDVARRMQEKRTIAELWEGRYCG